MPTRTRDLPIARGYTMGDEEIERVNQVLRGDGTLGPGPNVGEFENRCAALMGKKHGIMVNTGTDAQSWRFLQRRASSTV